MIFMKKIFTLALLAFAVSAGAQEMIVSSSHANVPELLSFRELAQMKSTSNNGDSTFVSMKNGAEYAFKADEISKINFCTREEALSKGGYADLKLLKNFNSLDELNSGDIIGIIKEQDYTGDEYVQTAYGTLMGLETVLDPMLQLNVSSLAYKNRISTSNLRFHITDIAYVSTNADGSKLALSARITYPYSTAARKVEVKDIYVDNHMTVYDESSKPTVGWMAALLGGMATKGYAVVAPDLIGFGMSSSRTQLYVDLDNNPRMVTDAIIAAENYVKLTESDDNIPLLNLLPSATVINTGGSQGATTALGTTYYMQNVLDKDIAAKLPKVSETRLCAGALDMKLTLDKFFATDSLYYPPIVPLLVSGAVSAHPEIMCNSKGVPFSLHEFFNPGLQYMTYDSSSYGLPGENTLWQMLNSKKVNSTPLANLLQDLYGLPPVDGAQFGVIFLDQLVNKELLKSNGKGGFELNLSDERAAALNSFAIYNNLSNPDLWVPECNVSIVHTPLDTFVPYANSAEFIENMSEKMEAKGYTASLTTLNSGLSHILVCASWVVAELTGLSVETVATMIEEIMTGNPDEG